MEESQLDMVLVPIGLLVFGAYHTWLITAVKRNPRNTVIGLNAESRYQWVFSLMNKNHMPAFVSFLHSFYKYSNWRIVKLSAQCSYIRLLMMESRKLIEVDIMDPLKNGVLAVQTIRNNMMASTLLATTAITLSSIIGVFVSNTSNVSNTSSRLVYGNKSPLISSVKYFTLILCFLVAFLCNVQSIRYYAHVSFLATVPTSQCRRESMEYAARCLNRGSLFWSLGLRAFYLSFPLFLWIFGPIPMLVCSCIMSIVLYFLDTTTSFTRQLHTESLKEKHINGLESPLSV